MLYRERARGQAGLWKRLTSGLVVAYRSRKAADLDLLSLSRHLRRDLGLDEGQGGLSAGDIWRK
ncbi:MAG: hypothetical protein HY834_01550 [Devosia nanyangense]|uniref:Uncharacterized protein n=1 Tax=Devosia nanyangense TaxID=1228055 RepID=A0A933NXA1_9HYPH|nr:hypothetical protein [Devosia nanyangense]